MTVLPVLRVIVVLHFVWHVPDVSEFENDVSVTLYLCNFFPGVHSHVRLSVNDIGVDTSILGGWEM